MLIQNSSSDTLVPSTKPNKGQSSVNYYNSTLISATNLNNSDVMEVFFLTSLLVMLLSWYNEFMTNLGQHNDIIL